MPDDEVLNMTREAEAELGELDDDESFTASQPLPHDRPALKRGRDDFDDGVNAELPAPLHDGYESDDFNDLISQIDSNF